MVPPIEPEPENEPVSESSFATEGVSGDPVDIAGKWPGFLEKVLRDRPNLGSFLSLAYMTSATGASIELKFGPNYRFQYAEVTKKNNRDEIVKMLQEYLGALIDVRIGLETKKLEAEGQNYIKQVADIPSTINDEIEKEPIIQSVLDLFDGEVAS